MNQLIHHCMLLAARSRLDHLSRGFSGRRARIDSNDLLVGLMILAGVAIAIWILSLVMSRQENRGPCNKPLLLFWELCKAHGLKLSDRWLLWRLARQHRLNDPARLFLEPERFETDQLGAAWQPHHERLGELRARLFADLVEVEIGKHPENKEKADAPKATRPATTDPWNQPTPA